VSQYQNLIADQIEAASELEEKVAACRALVAMEQLDQIKKLAQSADAPEVRTAASAVWIEKAPEAAVNHAVNLLKVLEVSDQAALIFNTFRRLENGPELLQQALEGKTLPEAVASVGLQVVQTSGLNLFDLEETLRTSGGIRAIGMEMSKADKEQLIQAALQSDSPSRGRQIYRKKELLCATCHRMDGIGGLTGPDLTTVGSYMTPNSILESILNPSSDIKQGYETVLLTKTDGEIISGLLHRKTNNATLIRQPNNQIIEVPAEEIAKIDVSPVSLMPPGLTRNLHKDELKDLLAFLINLGK
jgi:putative heme-binding domain-containing protein